MHTRPACDTPGPCPPTPNLVLEGGQAEVQQVQETTQLRERQVGSPVLQKGWLCILQYPQHTYQQGPTGLSREGTA